jgi:ABC-type cobalamin/Fe3+-siderophores transport system ATPase subunit
MLKTKHLTYAIEGKSLIQDISLSFSKGVLYGILGPNGSGKTTLLKSLAGIWKPSSGNVFWHDQDLLKKSRREISKIISLVPQNGLISFDFSVEHVVAMGRYPYSRGSLSSREKELIQWALTKVDLWELRHRRITQLSHGERQRVYIARSLVTESPVMLLDEPTASLDVRHQLEIWDLLRHLSAEGGKVIIATTHDLIITERFCENVMILNKGACIAIGSFSTAITPSLLATVFGVVSTSCRPEKSYDLVF